MALLCRILMPVLLTCAASQQKRHLDCPRHVAGEALDHGDEMPKGTAGEGDQILWMISFRSFHNLTISKTVSPP